MDNVQALAVLTLVNFFDKRRNINVYRATLHAQGSFAAQTTLRLSVRHLGRKATVNGAKVERTFLGGLFVIGNTVDFHIRYPASFYYWHTQHPFS